MTDGRRGRHAQLGAVRAWYEDGGAGDPLVLLPGGMQTVELCWGDLLPGLTADRRVIAVEPQGHGRTEDVPRTPTLAAWAGDVVELLDHLGLERADVFGFSLGGLVALETAVRYPDRVDRLVLGSVHTRADGYHPGILVPDPESPSPRLPTEEEFAAMVAELDRLAPDGPGFEAVVARLEPLVTAEENWSPAELAGVTSPTLVVVGDDDFVTVPHADRLRQLLPDALLAVLPGTRHTEVPHRADLLLPLLSAFLAR